MTIALRTVSTYEPRARSIYRFAAQHVDGFDARRAALEEDAGRRRVTRFLPELPEGGLACSHIVAAYDDTKLVGTALIHPTYGEADELVANGASADLVRSLLVSRRTLSGVAVDTAYRRQGIGTQLVLAATDRARLEGAQWLTGFMDKRNGSPDFYAALGFTVNERNIPVPPLAPALFREVHPGKVSGWWFYKELPGAVPVEAPPDDHAAVH